MIFFSLEFESKIAKFKKDGISNLHVISDFDATLTKAFVDGLKLHNSFSQLQFSPLLPQSFRDEAERLYQYYSPIEKDYSIPLEEKKKQMIDWWRTELQAMIDGGLNRDILERSIADGTLLWREGAEQFLAILNSYKVPTLIFSAGLGDVINSHLQSRNLATDNIRVVSNFFEFDDTGRAIGWNELMIHTCNKGEVMGNDEQYRKMIAGRGNVIILGDLVEDLDVLVGVNYEMAIKVGFLNKNVASQLDLYKKHFDLVVTDDADMHCVNDLFTDWQ